MYEIAPVLGVAIVISTILVSMVLHEVMHGYVANRLGDDTARLLGRLTLNPLKHIDPFSTIALPVLLYLSNLPVFGAAKPVPFNPSRLKYDEWGAALVAIAGPLTNLFLAIVSGLWLRFIIGFDNGIFSEILFLFMTVNLGFFTFNMIPYPPLDGSRVLYALAPDSVRDLMGAIERGGLMLFAVFIFTAYTFLAPLVNNIIIYMSEIILGVNIV